MTKASTEIIEMAFKLDSMKDNIGSLSEQAYRIAFRDSTFSVFPLFYLANKYFGDIYDTENETINFTFKDSPENANRIKALVSTMQNDHAWTNIFAFNAFIEASNGIELEVETVVPYSPAEISWGMINLAGIEGALTMPLKNEALAYIHASLSSDGWDAPPLFLMFKNIEDMFDNDKYITSIKSNLGNLSIRDIANMEDFDDLGIDNRPDLKNYLARNQQFCIDILTKFDKLMFDWTTAIRGE